MSPAGAGIAHFRVGPRPAQFIGPALVVAAVGLVLLLSGGSAAHASPRSAVAPLTPAWAEFQQNCVDGPAPGQGNPGAACVRWERNLVAAAIVPGYGLDVLIAAQEGQGAAYTVLENIGNEAVNNAAQGCGLYAEA